MIDGVEEAKGYNKGLHLCNGGKSHIVSHSSHPFSNIITKFLGTRFYANISAPIVNRTISTFIGRDPFQIHGGDEIDFEVSLPLQSFFLHTKKNWSF